MAYIGRWGVHRRFRRLKTSTTLDIAGLASATSLPALGQRRKLRVRSNKPPLPCENTSRASAGMALVVFMRILFSSGRSAYATRLASTATSTTFAFLRKAGQEKESSIQNRPKSKICRQVQGSQHGDM